MGNTTCTNNADERMESGTDIRSLSEYEVPTTDNSKCARSEDHNTKPVCVATRRQMKARRPSPSDQIIIDLNRKQQSDGIQRNIPKSVLCDQRRLVFISFIGLYRSWQDCPCSLLYSSILLVPRPFTRKACLNATSPMQLDSQLLLEYGPIFEDWERWQTFTELLRWKDAQSLVFWAADENDVGNDSDLVSAFWSNFNSKMVTMYDPVAKKNYQPLRFDANWWQNVYGKQRASHFGCTAFDVLKELYLATMRYKSIQEILYQSNPHSFRLLCNAHELANSVEATCTNAATMQMSAGSANAFPTRLNDGVSLLGPLDRNGFCRVHIIDDDIEPERRCNESSPPNDIWMVFIDYFEEL